MPKSEYNLKEIGGDPLCYVKNVNGQQLLFMPDGTKIPGLIMTRVTDEIREVPKALIKLFVYIKD